MALDTFFEALKVSNCCQYFFMYFFLILSAAAVNTFFISVEKKSSSQDMLALTKNLSKRILLLGHVLDTDLKLNGEALS
jgi:hypothetical protein